MVVRFFVLFRENSDVITYKVTTLFSVYGFTGCFVDIRVITAENHDGN